MRSKFRLELDVVIDTAAEPNVIETARRHCAAEGAMATVDKNGAERTLSVEEFIGEIEDALMELSERNPLLTNANVKVERVACRAAEPSLVVVTNGRVETEMSEANGRGYPKDPLDHDEMEDDLEEFETGLYLCRWPNGEFSLVKADDRKAAVVQLDECAGAEPAWLFPVDTCMVDFRLNDRGEIELSEFGEETGAFIWEKCFPELDEVLSSEDVLKHLSGKRSRKAAYKIRRAVEHERKRLWDAQGAPTPSKTALGRDLQKCLGTVGPVADRFVEVVANEILCSKKGERGKPN